MGGGYKVRAVPRADGAAMARTLPAAQPPPAVAAFVEACGLFHEQQGLPRMAGRILGWLLVCEPAVQSLTQLCRALGSSKSSVSTAVRLLVQGGLVARRAVAGDRNDYVEFAPDSMASLQVARIRRLRELLDDGLKALSGEPAARRARLRGMREHLAFIETELPALAERWRRQVQQRAR